MYKKGSVVYRQVKKKKKYPIPSRQTVLISYASLRYIVSVGGAQTNTA